MTRILRAADLFCGAGGTSQGAEQSGAAKVVCAVNHWQVAVDTHSANFPHAQHINSRLDQVNPGECPKIDLLFASPECTHHSRARGGRPTSDQQRSGAWDLMRWVEHHRPSFIVVENVPEFKEWGPVGDHGKPLMKFRGKFFDSWVTAIQSAGYKVDHRLLNAADFGAATSRTRLFVIARKGNRNPVFPEPTHAARAGGELPGMGMQRWRSAAEIIDWSIPCKSVFARSTPLKDNTLLRIEAGLRRFVEPFAVTLRSTSGAMGTGGTTRAISSPLSTITAGGTHHGVAVPFQYSNQSNGAQRGLGQPIPTLTIEGGVHLAVPIIMSSHDGGAARGVGQPTPTQTARGGVHLAIPFINMLCQGGRVEDLGKPLNTLTTARGGERALTVPYLVSVNHGSDGHTRGRSSSIDKPLAVATTKRGQAVCVPFVVTYYANGKAYPVTDPLCTLSTRERCGLATAIIETCGDIVPRTEGERKLLATMQELGVADVGFRMLANPELSLAQGFPAHYLFSGNKGDVTKQIGNAVCPDVAAAITKELAA